MSVYFNSLQHGNPLLSHIIQVPQEMVEGLTVDFSPNTTTGIFFLSCSYHRLHPEYITNRLKESVPYKLKIVLLKLDVADFEATLKELYILLLGYQFKLLVGANDQECAMLIENFAVFANKPVDFLLPKSDDDYLNQVQTVLTSIKGINKSDSLTLIAKFKSIKNLSNATKEDLADCSGIADVKIARLLSIMNSKLV